MQQQQFKKLAIAGAISVAMMGAGVAEAHVSYNAAGSSNGNTALGTASWSNGAAAGYVGNLPVNWIANVHNGMANPNVSYEVSTAHAGSVSSALTVQSHNNKWKPGASWGAALGFGLIDMHHAGNLTIEVKADTANGSLFTPGFTVFSGWDATASSSKHQAWNNTGDVTNPDTLGSLDLAYAGHSSTTTAGGATTLTLSNLAAGQYSIFIGGNGAGCTTGGSCPTPSNQQYIANITASPVPVPAAAWLMGTGLLGLVGMRRKKTAA